jgi:hypothetical protein
MSGSAARKAKTETPGENQNPHPLHNPQRVGHPPNLNGTPKATAELPGELVEWYHPVGQAVNGGNYGNEDRRVGHPASPESLRLFQNLKVMIEPFVRW